MTPRRTNAELPACFCRFDVQFLELLNGGTFFLFSPLPFLHQMIRKLFLFFLWPERWMIAFCLFSRARAYQGAGVAYQRRFPLFLLSSLSRIIFRGVAYFTGRSC